MNLTFQDGAAFALGQAACGLAILAVVIATYFLVCWLLRMGPWERKP